MLFCKAVLMGQCEWNLNSYRSFFFCIYSFVHEILYLSSKETWVKKESFLCLAFHFQRGGWVENLISNYLPSMQGHWTEFSTFILYHSVIFILACFQPFYFLWTYHVLWLCAGELVLSSVQSVCWWLHPVSQWALFAVTQKIVGGA